jgi:hypothetical protein
MPLLLLEDDEEEEDEDDDHVMLVAFLHLLLMWTAAVFVLLPGDERRSASYEQRLAWEDYCQRHHERGTLARRLRMQKHSFDKLVELLEADLLVDESFAELRGGAIIPPLCVYCTLRFLAGGSYLDITDVAGISQASFYRVVWKTITAIVKCSALRIQFPTTKEEITAAIAGFASISTEGAIHNCAGVVDGYLLRCKVPSKKEVKNVRSFFSGHYQCYRGKISLNDCGSTTARRWGKVCAGPIGRKRGRAAMTGRSPSSGLHGPGTRIT